MLHWPDREQSQRSSANMLAALRWPATVIAIVMLPIFTYGFVIGEEKFWPPSYFSRCVVYLCFSAALSWTGWYDQRARQISSDVDENDGERYHFWKWKGTPRWLYALNVILVVLALVPILSQPTQRLYAISLIGFLALMTGRDYLRWRSLHGKQQDR